MVQPRFLVEEPFYLCSVPSLTWWDAQQTAPVAPIQQVHALGLVEVPGAPRLQGVDRDLWYLRVAFGNRVRSVSQGAEATKECARKVLGQPGLVLLATHGWNVADQPLASYLLLYPQAHDDGRLTAAEIFELDVEADVVILSACYSGIADRSPLPGDDLFGLQRALLQAGARTVVSGLWDVYDGTGPELMGGVFEGLARGQSTAQALAEVQRAFIRKCRQKAGDPWIHPYFWAVYNAVSGDRVEATTSKHGLPLPVAAFQPLGRAARKDLPSPLGGEGHDTLDNLLVLVPAGGLPELPVGCIGGRSRSGPRRGSTLSMVRIGGAVPVVGTGFRFILRNSFHRGVREE
jgi:hypothetical protein